MSIVIRTTPSAMLPDSKTHKNRFQIHSASSDAVYVIAQNRSGLFWSCSCFGWIRHKHCKHLDALGLPGHHQPYEAMLESSPR